MAIDATVAGPDANSYLEVAVADALAADDFGPEREKWLDSGQEQKEQALKRATREIDGALRSGWSPYATDQRLLFPRSIDVASDVAFIPWPIRQATYEQATYLLANIRVLDAAASRRARGLASSSEPNISYSQGEEPELLCEAARGFLADFRRSSSDRGIRVARVTTGYIPA